MRTRTMTIATVSVLTLALAACGGNERRSSGGGGGGGNTGGSGNTGGGGGGGGGAAEPAAAPSADMTVTTADGSSQDVDASADTASKEIFGAWIAQSMVHLLITSETYVLDATLDASGGLPGEFTFGDDSLNSAGMIDGAAPYLAASGSISISVCADAVGDAISGRFNNVVFEGMSATGEAVSNTLDGAFNTAVVEVIQGEIECPEAEVPDVTGGGSNTGGSGTSGSCDGNLEAACANSDAACCPYMRCITECMMDCESQASEEDPMGAFGCMMACGMETCQPSAACQPLMQAVQTCEAEHGCDEIEDEDASDACTMENCCDEAKASVGL